MSFVDDIPATIAKAAHYGTSFVPDRRGDQERSDYASRMAADFESLKAICDTPEKLALLDAEFARYRDGCRRRTIAHLIAKGRTMSPMITGPSNFPTDRNRKRLDTERRRWEELSSFRTRALEAIRRTLCPELRPIMAGDDDAAERLRAKIAEAEQTQETYKAINAAHKAYLRDPATLDACGLSEAHKKVIREYKPLYSWEPHPIPPYALQNNNANIRRMKERLAQVERAKATPDTTTEGANATIEDAPSDNRVRLFFPGKPSAEVRTRLKSSGFRWAPSLGCWQAYRNSHSVALAKEIAGA